MFAKLHLAPAAITISSVLTNESNQMGACGQKYTISTPYAASVSRTLITQIQRCFDVTRLLIISHCKPFLSLRSANSVIRLVTTCLYFSLPLPLLDCLLLSPPSKSLCCSFETNRVTYLQLHECFVPDCTVGR